MIKKIISGGQTGVDRAALDVPIKLGISHGGWIPKGRKTEDGTLPDKYQLKEMSTASYPKRTEKNVLDSDGTLIVSHGKLNGGSALTRQLAKKHGRPWIHVDMNAINTFKAIKTINYWIVRHGIEILNVAGPRASKDPEIYQTTRKIIEAVLRLSRIEGNTTLPSHLKPYLPQTVDEAIDRIASELPLKDKIHIANMGEQDLASLHVSLGTYIREKFELWSGNAALMKSCRSISGEDELHEDDASSVIIEELWKKLRETHTLRAIK